MLFEFIGGAVKLLGIGRGLPFDRDIRPDIRIVCIELKPLLQTGLGVGYDGFSRALRHAHAAIDAFIRMDDEHIIAFVEAIHRTHFDAIHVFAFDAIIGDDKSHDAHLGQGRSGR